MICFVRFIKILFNSEGIIVVSKRNINIMNIWLWLKNNSYVIYAPVLKMMSLFKFQKNHIYINII